MGSRLVGELSYHLAFIVGAAADNALGKPSPFLAAVVDICISTAPVVLTQRTSFLDYYFYYFEILSAETHSK